MFVLVGSFFWNDVGDSNLKLKINHIVPYIIQMQTNWPKSDSIKIDKFRMSWFEFQNKFCNLSLVFWDRLYLALLKKIRILYGLLDLVTHCKCFKLLWSSPILVEKTTILYHMKEFCHQIFLKSAKCSPSLKTNDR